MTDDVDLKYEGALTKSDVAKYLRIALLVVGSLLFLSLFHHLMKVFYVARAPHPWGLAFAPVAITALASLTFRDRYADFIPLLQLALRSSSLGLLTYLIVEPPDLTLAAPAFEGDLRYINYAYYFAVACGVTSLFLPSFVMPTVIYILSMRMMTEDISEIPTSVLDIRYMIDMTLCLSVFAIVVRRWKSVFRDQDGAILQEVVVFIAFGLHLGNYFWSGVAKAFAGPYFWTWPIENQTQNLIPYAFDKGALPIAQWPTLTQALYDGIQAFYLPLNLAIIGFQLFAIVCVFRLSWLRAATIFYDLFHVGIFVLGGLFFWPWIWNNFTILVSCYKLRIISNFAKFACILTILLGNPLFNLYRPARLGWFDVANARQSYFEAVSDKAQARVPASFFLSEAFGISLGYMHIAPQLGQYDYTPWNAARSYERQVTSGTCPPAGPSDPAKVESQEQRSKRVERLQRFLRAHHAKMLKREAEWGHFNYFLRIYHQPSNPFLYQDFLSLPLKEVKAYELVVESVCYQMEGGDLKRNVVGRSVERYDVK